MEEMEERISGFEVRGSWTDVVELGERITEALSEAGVSGEAFDEWEEWRPKADERIDEEMSSKTSEQASVDEGEGEQADASAGEDLQTAGEKLREASAGLHDGDDDDGVVDSLQDSVDHAKRAVDTTGRRALRSVEDAVYRNVMTRIAPYYFDNELISANLRETSRFDDDEFVFEVGVNDDDLEAEISDRLEAYEAAVDRWHIDAPKDTSNVEATTGAEAAE